MSVPSVDDLEKQLEDLSESALKEQLKAAEVEEDGSQLTEEALLTVLKKQQAIRRLLARKRGEAPGPGPLMVRPRDKIVGDYKYDGDSYIFQGEKIAWEEFQQRVTTVSVTQNPKQPSEPELLAVCTKFADHVPAILHAQRVAADANPTSMYPPRFDPLSTLPLCMHAVGSRQNQGAGNQGATQDTETALGLHSGHCRPRLVRRQLRDGRNFSS